MAENNQIRSILVKDRDYRVICNFGKRYVLVYQLLYKKRNFTIVSSYDQYTLSKILDDWQNGKVLIICLEHVRN